jgi:hypothetical protein
MRGNEYGGVVHVLPFHKHHLGLATCIHRDAVLQHFGERCNLKASSSEYGMMKGLGGVGHCTALHSRTMLDEEDSKLKGMNR